MPQFRKKPVVVVAHQLNQGNAMDLARWAGTYGQMIVQGPPVPIRTLEGTMLAQEGDWIIRGVKGEFYPCKPDIFDATYERVDASPATEEPRRA